MQLNEALARLEELGMKRSARANTITTDHALALELWETGNLDARLLASPA